MTFSAIFRRASACDASRVRPMPVRSDAGLAGRLMGFRLVRQESHGRKVYIREQFFDRTNTEPFDWS